MHAVSLDLDDEDEPENPAEDEEGEESSDRERSVELAHQAKKHDAGGGAEDCLLYTSPSPRDRTRSRMPSSA